MKVEIEIFFDTSSTKSTVARRINAKQHIISNGKRAERQSNVLQFERFENRLQ
jgi:hypothetical protein